jgi:hypothetical protein
MPETNVFVVTFGPASSLAPFLALFLALFQPELFSSVDFDHVASLCPICDEGVVFVIQGGGVAYGLQRCVEVLSTTRRREGLI